MSCARSGPEHSARFVREIRYTERQKEALRFLGGDAETFMLFGGAGSGKTYLLTSFLVLAVSAFPGLRAAVLRRQMKDARESVMGQTFPAVMKQICGLARPAVDARINKRDCCYRHPNGSEIWFGGLDDAIARIKRCACPPNCRRLNKQTPCAVTGECADCSSPDRICMVTVVMDRRPRSTDVHVVLVDEDLGY